VPLKAREVIRILRALGGEERPAKGSHIRFRVGTCFTTVPNHMGDDLAIGTVRGIEADLAPCLGPGWLRRYERGGGG
jgi:predicted RNA binding protein YcfA (HicA-like mRNA interferase family)